jgi:hydroxymethylpyrimidine pyrophosphatase-like HAD family hydrolase
LLTLVERVRQAYPELVLADDNLGRLSDITFDIGERVRVPPAQVASVRQFVARHDGRTFESSIHLHITLDTDDKASGTVAALARELGLDESASLHRFAFVGDSRNDEACFGAFRLTFGVDNIRAHVGHMSVGPRWVSPSPAGAGFAEIARRLLELGAGARAS